MRYLLLPLTVVFLLCTCSLKRDVDEQARNEYSVDDHFILKNGTHFVIRGVVYVPGYPGYLPWEIENAPALPDQLRASISTDIANIKALGANSVRFWGAPRYCYEALYNEGGLDFIQTIWVDGEAPDFQYSLFKETTRAYIREVVDRIYSVFTDNDPPLIAFLIGNELSEGSILATDNAHPEITSFTGNYIIASHLTATEAFLAEMADYIKTYEYENYGNISLVSYANYIMTPEIIDTPFLDFRCHNVYSYGIDYFQPNTGGGTSSGTLLQGWVEALKAMYPYLPLLITETGLSVSPNAAHAGPPNYGYGGNTEAEQAVCLVQNITDISTTLLPTAGVVIHELLDAWWKFGLEDSYSQDPDDVEEWFGIMRIVEDGDWWATEPRPAYDAVQGVWGE